MSNPETRKPATRRPSWTRRVAFIALLASTATASACVRNSREDDAAEPIPATYLKVENRAFLDMTIYAIRNSQRIRLGNVTGNSTAKLLIPSNLLFNGSGMLQFLANPIGGNRQPVSQEISVSAGDEIQLIIPPS